MIGILNHTYLRVGLFSVAAATSCNVSAQSAVCNVVPGTIYSVSEATAFLIKAADAIDSCEVEPFSGACKVAHEHLTAADKNLAQVWVHGADSTMNCWSCSPPYLLSEADALANLVTKYNAIVAVNRAYWYSNATYTREGLNTGWGSTPVCKPNVSTLPLSQNPLHGVSVENEQCDVGFLAPGNNRTLSIHNIDMDGNCYAIFQEVTSDFTRFRIYPSITGSAPADIEPSYQYGWGGSCRQVLTQIYRRCGMSVPW